MTTDTRGQVLSGQSWVPQRGNDSGDMAVVAQFDQQNLSPFNDLIVAELSPMLQIDFVYGINSQQGAATVNTTGVGDMNVGRLRLQTGTGAAGSAKYKSRRTAQYRPGQGMIARFTFPFSTPVASSVQQAGVGDESDGYFFGALNTAAGILHRNNTSDTWIAQTAWNGDKCDGTGASGFNWDVTKGCPMAIAYPFLGYGNITFWIQNPTTSRWILCHTLRYANTSATTQVRNPDLGIYAYVANTGNTSNLIAYVGSCAIFLCGKVALTGKPKWADDSTKATITTETNLLTIRNATTFNGVANKGMIRINSLSIDTSSTTAVATLRVKVGVTLGGSPSYTPTSGSTADNGATLTSAQSLSSVDKAGTTVTGGTYIFAMGRGTIDVREHEIFIAPGETLTISGTSSSAATLTATANWTEDI